MSRDPDDAYDRWREDGDELRLHRIGHLMPPSIVAADAQRCPAPVELTPEERQERDRAWMDRLRAGAGQRLFAVTRRR